MAAGNQVRTASVEVRPVSSRREPRTFIKLPWRLYRDEPNWVAPLVMDLKKRLDLETNTPMNRAMEGMGGEIKRWYRVYERVL